MNALKCHWCETSLLSQAGLKHVSGVQRFHLQEVYAREQLVLYPAKNEEIYGIFHMKKIFMSCYITFKKKTSTCGSQLGHMGHIPIVLWVSGSNRSTGATHSFSTLDR